MSSSPLCALVIVLASFGVSSCSTAPTPAALASSASPPNFLVIVTDDQRRDAIGFAGGGILATPEMDALAAQGVRFSHAFVTTPICAASRASILTGLWERAHGYTFGQAPIGTDLMGETYPYLLRRAGYRTGFVGKLGLRVIEGGAQEMFDVFRPSAQPYRKEAEHLTDINTDRAIEFIEGCSADQPFCLSLSYWAPHAEDQNPDQYVWPASCDGMYDDVDIPVPATSDPAFFAGLPEFLRESLNRERWHWRFDTPEKGQRMVKGYYRMISAVDSALGRLRRALDERGLADDTIVILIGDNGYFLGERGYAGKWSMHDLSTRVPLVVHDPRPDALRGATLDEFTLNVDLAPTLLALAGVPVPERMQGRSLAPLLRGDAPHDWRTEVFTEHLWDYDRIPRTEALRTQRWKYIRYLDHPEYEELYDLERDPHEELNLADDPRHAASLRTMRARCSTRGEELALQALVDRE